MIFETSPNIGKLYIISRIFRYKKESGIVTSQIITDWPRSSFKALDCMKNEIFSSDFQRLFWVWNESSAHEQLNGDGITAIQRLDCKKNGRKIAALLTPWASPPATGTISGDDDLGPYSLVGGGVYGMALVVRRGMEAIVPTTAVVREEKRKRKRGGERREMCPLSQWEVMEFWLLIGHFKVFKKIWG